MSYQISNTANSFQVGIPVVTPSIHQRLIPDHITELDEEPSCLDSRSLSELATIQGVEALPDVRVLFGTWPGDDDDDFEASIRALRVRS